MNHLKMFLTSCRGHLMSDGVVSICWSRYRIAKLHLPPVAKDFHQPTDHNSLFGGKLRSSNVRVKATLPKPQSPSIFRHSSLIKVTQDLSPELRDPQACVTPSLCQTKRLVSIECVRWQEIHHKRRETARSQFWAACSSTYPFKVPF